MPPRLDQSGNGALAELFELELCIDPQQVAEAYEDIDQLAAGLDGPDLNQDATHGDEPDQILPRLGVGPSVLDQHLEVIRCFDGTALAVGFHALADQIARFGPDGSEHGLHGVAVGVLGDRIHAVIDGRHHRWRQLQDFAYRGFALVAIRGANSREQRVELLELLGLRSRALDAWHFGQHGQRQLES
jgi:hypothetical protein